MYTMELEKALSTLDAAGKKSKSIYKSLYKRLMRLSGDKKLLDMSETKIIKLIDDFGIKNIEVPGYEADDIVGTLVKKFHDQVQFLVISNDRDLWQLTTYGAKIMLPQKASNFEYIDFLTAKQKFELDPSQIVDYKGLRGDPSDNIPGVYGVGDKTAKKLLNQYGSVENIYKNLQDITPKSLQTKLTENYEQALLSKQLATIETNVPLTINIEECEYNQYDKEKAKEIFEAYNFKSLIKRMGFELNSKKDAESNQNQLNLF